MSEAVETITYEHAQNELAEHHYQRE